MYLKYPLWQTVLLDLTLLVVAWLVAALVFPDSAFIHALESVIPVGTFLIFFSAKRFLWPLLIVLLVFGAELLFERVLPIFPPVLRIALNLIFFFLLTRLGDAYFQWFLSNSFPHYLRF